MRSETVVFLKKLFGCKACGSLAPQPGIGPVPPEVEAWSLNHWTTREVPETVFKNSKKKKRKQIWQNDRN